MWMKPGVRLLLPLLFLTGCQANAAGGARPSASAATGASAAGALDPSVVRPLTLRYRAVHRGDHRPWSYIAHVRIQRDSYRGAPAWRTSYRIEDLGTGPRARWESTTIVDRDTLALLAGEDVSGGSFGDSRTRVNVEGVRLIGQTEAQGVSKPIDVELRGFVARDLDLLALSLPLRPGFRMRLAVVNDSSDGLRPFAMSVEGPERVRVPAGEFDAWRIAVTPLDGNRRATATYHVRGTSPRIILRKEYVVNPDTRGTIRRSIGVEELEASPRAGVPGDRVSAPW